jgi:hypothetical protein
MRVGFYWFDPKKDHPALHGCGLKVRTLVFVESYVDSVDGRLSNWVDFRVVRADGRLGRSCGTYLGDQFSPARYALKAVKI